MERMELEQKKEYLKEYEKAIRKMERSEIKIKELRLNSILPTVKNDGMPHAKSQNDLSVFAALLDQEERNYRECKVQAAQKCKEIMERIEQLKKEDEKDILTFRYIERINWNDICMKMKLSSRQVHRIHSQALNNFKMS